MSAMRAKLRSATRGELGWLLSDTAVTFGIRVAAAVLVYATHVLLARWMGVLEFGEFVYTAAWLWIIALTSTLGLSGAANRFISTNLAASDQQRVVGYIRTSRQITVSVGIVLATGLAGFVAFIAPADNFAMYLLACVCVPFYGLTVLHANVARAHLWFVFASLTSTLFRPVLLLIAIAAAAHLGAVASATTVMGLLCAVVVAITIGQYVVIERRLQARYAGQTPVSDTRIWLRAALPILVAHIFVSYSIDLNLIVGGLFLPPSEIAVYNAALRTVGVITFGFVAVGIAIAPRVARAHAEGDTARVQRLLSRATQLMFWPAIVAFAGLAIFGERILAMFGDEFVAGYDALLLLGGAQIIASAFGPLVPLLTATGHQNRCLVVLAISVLMLAVLTAALAPRYGVTGCAIAIVVATGFWSIWLYRLTARLLRIDSFIVPLRRSSRS